MSKQATVRFRFSLRALLVVVTVICVAFGWIMIELQIVKERAAYWRRFNDHESSLRLVLTRSSKQASIPWIRRMLGDSPLGTLLYYPSGDPDRDELRMARELFPEARIFGWPTNGFPRDPDLPAEMDHLPDDEYFQI